MAFVGLAVLVIALWFIVTGLRLREMSAMGAPFGVWRLDKNSVLFWFATLFNALVLYTGVVILLEELTK